ncbi:MAG: acid--CoA ligase, partial [Microbacteriaceae bacterium]|nr:acid--CoA ligase [Microbacteriaceae bacterium]
VWACGGADVTESLVIRARSVLGSFVTRAYGCSEMPTLTWGKPGDDPVRIASTDGRPIGVAEVRVVDEHGLVVAAGEVGECEAIGAERCVGYVDSALNEALFTADGWVRTGDLVSVDAEGYLSVRGRKKDIIVRSGENISAREVEILLMEHDAVLEAAVVAAPDPLVGERTCAFVALRSGSQLQLTDITAWMDARGVAKIKWPERLVVVHEFPRTGFGKVDKGDLRRRAAELAGGAR